MKDWEPTGEVNRSVEPSPPDENGLSRRGTSTGVLQRASKETLRDFLYRLIATVKARKLYPPGHERLKKQLESWRETTQGILAAQGEISIFVQAHSVSVNGETFGREDSIVGELIPELVRRFVRYVGIQKGVELQELEAFAGILLQDPSACEKAEEPNLYTNGTPHIHILPFSYDMERLVESEEDLKAVRTLARYEKGAAREEYVVRRMGEFQVSAEEKKWLNTLLFQPEIEEKLNSLCELLSMNPSGTRVEMRTTDLFFHLVRMLAEAKTCQREADKTDATQTFLHMMDAICKRLVSLQAMQEAEKQREILDRIACQTRSSPESLACWLSKEIDLQYVGLSPRQAEILKEIFHNPESGHRSIRFGKTDLLTQETPKDPFSTVLPQRAERDLRAPNLETLAQRFEELRKEIGTVEPILDLKGVPQVHVAILLEVLRREEEPAARERILKEIRTFLGRQLSREVGRGEPLFAQFFGDAVGLKDERDLAAILQSPEVCQHALREFLQGERRLAGALSHAARMQRDSFAVALGSLLLESKLGNPWAEFEHFILLCQDELGEWLLKRMRNQEPPPPLQRVVAVALACQTPRIIPLVEKLLSLVEPDAHRVLLRRLVQADNPAAVQVLNRELEGSDISKREAVLSMLGQSRQPLAEEILLKVAGKRGLSRAETHEKTIALSSLQCCGTERSLDLLRKLAGKWRLLLTPRGRQIRAGATEALRAVEMRLKSQRSRLRERNYGH